MPRVSLKIQDRVAAIESLTCRVEEAGKLSGVSATHFMRMALAGKTPKILRLGGAVRFNRREIRDWISAGCSAPNAQ